MKITKKQLWNLDITLTRYILPRLIEFRDFKDNNETGYPASCKNKKEWLKILDEMIFAFEHIINEFKEVSYRNNDESNKRCNKGLKLFGKHFRGLWD